MIAVIKQILAASKKAGIHAVMHCGTPEYAAKAIGWGFDLVTISNDVRHLAGSAAASVGKARELIGQGPAPAGEKASY